MNREPGKGAGLRLAPVLFLVLVLTAGCATAPRYPAARQFSVDGTDGSVWDHLEQWIPAFMAEKKIPGLAIAVADGSGVIWAQGFGFADKGKRIPFTAGTRSMVASVSKLFTCAAVMKLVEEGRVGLDEPLATYLPGFSIKTRGWSTGDITIRRMLTQHSGLPSDWLKGFITGDARPADYPDTFLKLPALLADEYAATPPDTVFSYSNIAYSLLGEVVARVGGMSFAEQVRQVILDPLGMKDSSFLMTDEERQAMARGHVGGKAVAVPYMRDIPAGALVSTAADMGKFVAALIASAGGGSHFLRQDTVSEMWRKQNDGVPLDFDFGVGLTWWQVPLPGLPDRPVVGHGGDIDPFHAFLAIEPRQKVGVFIMVNGVNGTGSFSLGALAAEALRGVIEVRSGTEAAAAKPTPAVVPLPAGLTARVAGYYATPNGLAQVRVENGRLRIFAFGNWLRGVYHEDGSISLEARLLSFKIPVPALEEIHLTFESIGDEVYLCLRIGGTLIAPCAKVKPVDVPDSWSQRSGRYRIENTDADGMLSDASVALDRSSGFLVLKATVLGARAMYPLQAISATEARFLGVGRNLGETLRVVAGEDGERLLFSGYVLSKR